MRVRGLSTPFPSPTLLSVAGIWYVPTPSTSDPYHSFHPEKTLSCSDLALPAILPNHDSAVLIAQWQLSFIPSRSFRDFCITFLALPPLSSPVTHGRSNQRHLSMYPVLVLTMYALPVTGHAIALTTMVHLSFSMTTLCQPQVAFQRHQQPSRELRYQAAPRATQSSMETTPALCELEVGGSVVPHGLGVMIPDERFRDWQYPQPDTTDRLTKLSLKSQDTSLEAQDSWMWCSPLPVPHGVGAGC